MTLLRTVNQTVSFVRDIYASNFNCFHLLCISNSLVMAYSTSLSLPLHFFFHFLASVLFSQFISLTYKSRSCILSILAMIFVSQIFVSQTFISFNNKYSFFFCVCAVLVTVDIIRSERRFWWLKILCAKARIKEVNRKIEWNREPKDLCHTAAYLHKI